MKQIIIIGILFFCFRSAAAQDSINPYNIQQRSTIELHHTDVYYHPFVPPASTDTREQLSCEALWFRDSDGIAQAWANGVGQPYAPMTHGVVLQNYTPPGDSAPLGIYAVWQRLFQAMPGSDGTRHDIIAGGYTGDTVTISKNEDVDFRASGTVKLKNGFHAMPGCFFHAYQAPRWDTAVFSDEFDDSAKLYSQWHISNGHGGNDYPQGNDCPADTNAYLVDDTGANGAHDGHALDLTLRIDTLALDTCHCVILSDSLLDKCENVNDAPIPDTMKTIFPTAFIRSCPFPFLQRTDSGFGVAYMHIPYGKYEIREKIPHVKHHTNNWGGCWNFGYEYDMNETSWDDDMSTINPDWSHSLVRGPARGRFGMYGGQPVFISSGAQWCPSNKPNALIIDNVPYGVQLLFPGGTDTVVVSPNSFSYEMGGFPSSLTSDLVDSIEFNYTIDDACTADKLPWTVKYDSTDDKWDEFRGGYRIAGPGDTLYFSKWNQPVQVTLTVDTSIIPPLQKTIACHWEYNLNHPGDTGWLMLDPPSNGTDTLTAADLHSGDEAFGFMATDLYHDAGYPVSPVPFNANNTTGHYEYHTFAMEWLPNEVRILVDSVVVRRFPDRMVPRGTPYSDWVATMPRAMSDIRPAEIDIDWGGTSDPFGTTPGTQMYMQRQYLEHALATPGWPGVWADNYGHMAAHHLIDYIKVFDVPKDVQIPNYPQ